MNFDLVIFDCDGVLVDSEPITNAVFVGMLHELGLVVTLQDLRRDFVGRSMAQCVGMIETGLGRPVPDGWLDDYRRRIAIALARELKPVTGIESALAAIDIPVCVASSGDHDKMRTTLGITRLLPRFDGKMFSVTQVDRGKPDPDVFLFAAAQMGVAPERCAVVEDTAIGARAGVAAGMTVFGYAATSDPDTLSAEGAIVFDDMARLPALLATGSPETRRLSS